MKQSFTLFLVGLAIAFLLFNHSTPMIHPVSASPTDALIIGPNINYTITNVEQSKKVEINKPIKMKENSTLFLSNINGSVVLNGDVTIEGEATICLNIILGYVVIGGDITIEKESTLSIVGNLVRKAPPAFRITGSIFVEQNSMFYIKDTPIEIFQYKNYQYNVIVNNSRMHIENSFLVSLCRFNITFYQNSFGTIHGLQKIPGYRTPTLRFMDKSYGEVNGTISESKSGFIELYGSSNVTMTSCLLETGVKAYDSCTLHVHKSGETVDPLPVLEIFDTSNVYLEDSAVELLVACGFSNIILINSELDTLAALENTRVDISKTKIKLALHTHGYSAVTITNSQSEISTYARDNSTLEATSSEFNILTTLENTRVDISKTKIRLLRTGDNSFLSTSNSTIAEMNIRCNSVNATIEGLKPGFFYWLDFKLNCSVDGDQAPNILLNTTQIQTALSFEFAGPSNVTIENSQIENLHLAGSSTVQLIKNSTIGTYYIEQDARICFWYIRILVIDGYGTPLSEANVTVLSNDIPTESGTTNADGLITFTNRYPGGEYIISAAWNNYSTQQSVQLFGKDITIALSLPQPWWQKHLIEIAMFAMLVLLISVFLVAWKRKSH